MQFYFIEHMEVVFIWWEIISELEMWNQLITETQKNAFPGI